MPYRPNVAYKSFHVAANNTKLAVGMLFDGTIQGAITAGAGVQFTLATRVDGDPGWIQVGSQLIVDVGAGVAEIVTVTAISGPFGALFGAANPFTLTATFAHNHAASAPVRFCRGTRLGTVTFGGLGSAWTLTLFNGNPDIAGTTLAVITPAAEPYEFYSDVDGGLFYTTAGTTPGDLTIAACPIPF